MNYIVTKQLKSKGLAVFLTILFGGVGLFYTSIIGGIVMTIIFPAIVFFLLFSGQFFLSIAFACCYYVICMIWAIMAVNSYNRKVQEGSSPLSVSPQSLKTTDEDNYVEYRRSTSSDNTFLWLLITIIVAGLMFYGVYYFRK